MRNFYRILIIGIFLLFTTGCIKNSEGHIEKNSCDIKINSIDFDHGNHYFMGDYLPLHVDINSNSDNPYRIDVKYNGNLMYSTDAVSNYSDVLNVPLLTDGVNSSLKVIVNPITCIDKKATNNIKDIQLTVYPITNFHTIDTSNSVRIFNRKTIATKINLKHKIDLQSVGFFLRSTLMLSPNSTLYYYILNDSNGKPGDILYNLSMKLIKLRIDDRWKMLMLNLKEPVELKEGNYWLQLYIDDESYVDVLCYNESMNITKHSTIFSGEIEDWEDDDCNPYYVIGGQNVLYTYKSYSLLLNQEN